MIDIKVKRVYESAEKTDGFRILVDRLWPRGIKKIAVDLWLKDIAPSNALRKWYSHDPEKWLEFKKRYFKELKTNKDLVKLILEKILAHKVTLLYGAKDEQFNNAIALKEYLKTLKSHD